MEAVTGESALLSIRVQPRAKRDEVVGERGGAVVIRLAAPPVDGKANAALTAFIAKQAKLPRSHVEIVRGATSRDKLVRVNGITEHDLRRALGLGERPE
jgi:uncharacterized protein (TIGR00251 family)